LLILWNKPKVRSFSLKNAIGSISGCLKSSRVSLKEFHFQGMKGRFGNMLSKKNQTIRIIWYSKKKSILLHAELMAYKVNQKQSYSNEFST